MLLAQMVVEYAADVSGLTVGVTAAAEAMTTVGAVAEESSGYLATLADQTFTTGVGFDGLTMSADEFCASMGIVDDSLAGIDASFVGVAASADAASASVSGAAVSADGAAVSFDALAVAEDAVATAGDAIESSLAAVGTALAVLGVAAAVAGGISVKMAADYQQSMNKVQALTGASTDQMNQFDSQLKQLSMDTGVAPQKLSEGLYNVVSAGYQGTDAMTLLGLATKDSVIGMTDASVTTKSLTALLAQFGLGAADANRVNGEMLDTVTLGSGTFEQYSSNIVKAASSAAQFHVPMEAMNAAYATLTSSQIKSAQASTDFQQSLKVMDGNIGTVTKSLNSNGIAFDETKFNAMDYGHQVVYLNDALEQANQKHVKVTGVTLQAAQAINTIASHIDTYNKNLTALSDKQSMAQKTQEAWSTTVGGFNVSLSRLWATAQVVLIDIGQKLLPVVTKAVDWLSNALASPEFKQFATGVGRDIWLAFKNIGDFVGPLIPQFQGIATNVGKFFSAFNDPAIQKFIGEIGGDLKVDLTWLIAALGSKQFGDFAHMVGTDIVSAIKFAIPVVKEIATNVIDFAQSIITHVQPIIAWWSGAWPTIATVIKFVWSEIQGWIQIAWAIIQGIILIGLDIIGGKWGQAWTDAKNMFAGVWDGIKTLVKGAYDFIIGIFTDMYNALVGHSIIPDMINGIVDWFAKLPGKALDLFNQLKTNALNALNTLKTDALNAGSNIVQAIGTGITNGLHFVTDAITNVTSWIAAHLPHSPAKMGPLMDLENQGMEISNQVAKGMINGVPLISSAMNNLAKPVTVGLKGVASASGTPLQGGGTQDNSVHIYLDGKEMSNQMMKRVVKDLRGHGLKK